MNVATARLPTSGFGRRRHERRCNWCASVHAIPSHRRSRFVGVHRWSQGSHMLPKRAGTACINAMRKKDGPRDTDVMGAFVLGPVDVG